jgi:hypothetical protein
MDVWRKNEYLQTRIYFQCLTQVRNAVTDSTVVEIFKEFKKTEQKSNRRNVSQRKAGYIGRFVMQIENHKQWQDML